MASTDKPIERLTIAELDELAGTTIGDVRIGTDGHSYVSTGPIDWTKITVSASTSGSSFISSGTIKVTETPQKTVFSDRLMAEARISDFELTSSYDDKELFRHYQDELERRVRKTACEESKCGTCPQMKIMIVQEHDSLKAQRRIGAVAMCGYDKGGVTSVICPDGSVATRKGSGRITSFEENLEMPKSAPEFSSKNEEPYIRIDPDKPSSAGSEVAW